jgi:hypothetical protein
VSLWFEDFVPGTVHVSVPRVINASDCCVFRELTGDTTTSSDCDIPVAMLFAIATGLSVQLGVLDESLIAFCGVDQFRAEGTAREGVRVRIRKRVVEANPVGSVRGFVTFETELIDDFDRILIVYRDKFLVRARELPGI